jgi:hypothetical protein
MPISPDGVTMEHGKVFNRTYPGPWIGESKNRKKKKNKKKIFFIND